MIMKLVCFSASQLRSTLAAEYSRYPVFVTQYIQITSIYKDISLLSQTVSNRFSKVASLQQRIFVFKKYRRHFQRIICVFLDQKVYLILAVIISKIVAVV